MRNLLGSLTRAAQGMVATLVPMIFAESDDKQVKAKFTHQFPAASELLIQAEADIFAFSSFSPEHWRQIWSNNNLELLNKSCQGEPTSSASFRNTPPSFASAERYSPAATPSGPSPGAT